MGAMARRHPGQKFGRRDSLRVMAIFYVISALGCAFAWNWPALIVFRFIGGLGIGGSSVLGPDVHRGNCPSKSGAAGWSVSFRSILSSAFCWRICRIISSARMRLGADEWRWQLGISAVPAVLFLVMLFGIPRSPRWLVTQNASDEALRVLRHIGEPERRSRSCDEIVASVASGRSASPASRCSQRKYRRPVFLAITVGMFNQLSGINAILYYLNDIFALAGSARFRAICRPSPSEPRIWSRHLLGDDGHRQVWPQDAAADRRCRAWPSA